MMRRRSSVPARLGTIAAVALPTMGLVLALTGCGIDTDDSFEVIPPQDIPFGLSQPSTTTTTTTATTIPDPSDPASTTDPGAGPGPGPDPTESTAPIPQVELAEIYLVAGLDRLQRQAIPLSAPVGAFQIIAVLEEPPGGDASVGLRTAVRPDLVRDLTSDRGVATIDLVGAELERMSSRDQRLAIAQLVMSVTSSVRGVGQVTFSIDGVPAEIGTPPDYTLREPGEPLAYADFEVLLLGPRTGAADDESDAVEPPADEPADADTTPGPTTSSLVDSASVDP